MGNIERIKEIIGKNSNSENPNGDRINKIRSILKKPEVEPETNTFPRLAKMPIAGAAHAVESMTDLVRNPLKQMTDAMVERMGANPLMGEKSQEYKKALGLDIKPKNTAEKIAYGTGELAVPIPGLGIASKAGKTLKNAASHIGESLGLSTAIHGTPKIAEEGTAAGSVEDLLKGTAFGAGKSMLKPKETAAKISTLGAKPSQEVLKTANKYGIDLPVNVGLNSSQLNAMSNVLKHSPFSADKFKQSFTKANQQTLDTVKHQLNKLGPDVSPSAAGHDFNEFLKSQEKEVSKIVDDVYAEARLNLKPNDVVSVNNTKKTIDAMKDILQRDIKSPQTKKVTGIIIQIADSFGLLPKSLKLPKGWEEGNLSPAFLSKLTQAIEKESPKVPIQKLLDAKTEIGNILDHKQDVVGMERWLKGLQRSIAEDIGTTTNSKFKQSQKFADKFYQENYAARFKEDLANSVLTGSEPLYVYNKLNNLESIKTLEKVAGSEPKAKQLVDSLKKAKAREIFNNALKEEGIHAGNYTKIFNKNEVNQEYFKGLLGPEVYNNLKELSKITSAMSKAGQEMLNTSHTEYTRQYMNTLSKLGSGAAGAIMLSVGAIKTLGTGTAAIAANNGLSRLLVDPEYVRLARNFAAQNAKGKPQLHTFKKLTNRAAIILRQNTDKEEK